jgi:L-threonylcarbamoyladenylate synthase
MLDVHYAPRTPLTLISGRAARERLAQAVAAALAQGQRVGVLALEEDTPSLPAEVRAEIVGTWAMPERSAARLYQALRALDRAGLEVLFVRDLADPNSGLGRALADRLRRASHRVLDSRD